MLSSVRAPRSSNGTPTEANSSASHPTPTPRDRPSSREDVEGRELLGHVGGLALRKDEDPGSEPQGSGDRRGIAEPHQRIRDRHVLTSGIRPVFE